MRTRSRFAATASSCSPARTTRSRFPTLARADAAGVAGATHFLGMLGATAVRRVNVADDTHEPAGMRFVGLRTLFFKVPEPLLALAARAFQVVDWDRTHRFCGRCGTPTRDARRASAPRSARRAGSSPIRACRRR